MDKLETILEYIFNNIDEMAELRIGVWDEDIPHTFYATIAKTQTGNVILGESSYGAETIEEALHGLIEEINKDL